MQSRWIQKIILFSKSAYTTPSTSTAESADRSSTVKTESADSSNIVRPSPVIHLFCTAFECTVDFNPEQCSARMT